MNNLAHYPQAVNISLCLVEHAGDTSPAPHKVTFPQLLSLLKRHGETYKYKDGPALIGGVFRTSGTRHKRDVKRIELLLLDFDGATGTVAELMGPLGTFQHITYSTFNHGNPDKWEPGKPRFRAVIPLARPVSVEEHAALWLHVNDLLGGVIDNACKDAARIMYTPRRRNPDAIVEPWIEPVIGPILDPDRLPTRCGGVVSCAELKERIDAERAARNNNITSAPDVSTGDVRAALESIPPDTSYDKWFRIGTALKTIYGDDAFDTFNEWSAGGIKYEGQDKCWQSWDKFPSDPETATGDPVTLGTLFHIAMEHGWIRSVRPKHTEAPNNITEPDEYHICDTLEDARDVFPKLYKEAMRRGGVTAVKSDTGAGKTVAFMRTIVEQGAALDKPVWLAFPTKQLRGEKRLDFVAMQNKYAASGAFHGSASVTERESRGSENCVEFDNYLWTSKLAPGAGGAYCAACEQRDICPFIAKRRESAQVVFMTHETLSYQLQQPVEDIEFDWSGMARDWCDGVKVRPHLTRRPATWEIGTKRDDYGVILPEPDRWVFRNLKEFTCPDTQETKYKGATSKQYKTPELAAEAAYVCAETYGLDVIPAIRPDYSPEARETILQTIADAIYCEPTAEGIADTLRHLGAVTLPIVFIDEDYAGLEKTVSIDRGQLLQMQQSGEISLSDSDRTKLESLIMQTEQVQNDRPKSVQASEIETQVASDNITVCAPGEYPGARDKDGKPYCVDDTLLLRDWKALDALRETLKRGWQGSYAAAGQLFMTYQPVHYWRDYTDCIIYSDATNTPDHVKALFRGHFEQVHYVEVGAKNDHVKVVHVNSIHTSKNHIREGESRSERGREAYQAIHATFPDALHFTHKKTREGEAGAKFYASLPTDAKVEHYNSGSSRGSNDYQDIDCVVLDAYHVGAKPIETNAYLWCERAGDDWNDENDRNKWLYLANQKMQCAPVIQAAGRIRPLNASATRPKTIVVCGIRPDAINAEWSDYECIDGLELLAINQGIFEGDIGRTMQARIAIDSAKTAIILPTRENAAKPHEYWTVPSIPHYCLYIKAEPRNRWHELVNTRGLADFVKNTYQGHWQAFATKINAEYTTIETDAPGQAIPILYRGPLTVERVSESLVCYGIDVEWFRLRGGDKVYTNKTPLAMYHDALLQLPYIPVKITDVDAELAQRGLFSSKRSAQRTRLDAGYRDIIEIRAYWLGHIKTADKHDVFAAQCEDAMDYAAKMWSLFPGVLQEFQAQATGDTPGDFWNWLGTQMQYIPNTDEEREVIRGCLLACYSVHYGDTVSAITETARWTDYLIHSDRVAWNYVITCRNYHRLLAGDMQHTGEWWSKEREMIRKIASLKQRTFKG